MLTPLDDGRVLSTCNQKNMDDERQRTRLLISEQYTLPELVDHMKHGKTVLGQSVNPYPWLEYATRPKTDTELKMERLLTSCSFKTATSCVLGRDI